MTNEKQQSLRELIDAVCEERITPEETSRLESLLTGDEEAQWFYLRHMNLWGSLRWDQRNAAEWQAVERMRPQQRPAAARRWWSARVAWGTAAACCLLIAVVLWRRDDHATQPYLARVAQAVDAKWSFQGQPGSRGSQLNAGTLDVQQGVLRVDLAGGASLTLEGPARLRLISKDHAHLQHGRLTALAPQPANLAIDTPSMSVVDRGTAFGIAADNAGMSEVLVFKGEVEVTARAENPIRQVLAEGGAARVAAAGGIESVEFDGRPFARSWPIAYGVLSATGVVKFVEPAASIVPGRYEDDEHLIVFPENEAVRLADSLNVTVDRPGSYVGSHESVAATIAAGRRVRSYLLQFNPVGRRLSEARQLSGSITFDRPILGLMFSNPHLAGSDAALAPKEFDKLTRGGRGLEPADRVELSDDRRTLAVHLSTAGATDQIRLVIDLGTDETPPAAPLVAQALLR
jgi:ferric-dicitrate binding protein FerR (iron transport regulator)